MGCLGCEADETVCDGRGSTRQTLSYQPRSLRQGRTTPTEPSRARAMRPGRCAAAGAGAMALSLLAAAGAGTTPATRCPLAARC